MAKKTTTAVATQPKDGAVAKGGKIDFGADRGKGMEGTTSESFAIPFLTILQKGSPQVDEAAAGKGMLIKGAKAGEIFNTVTKARIAGAEGILIVPCAYKRVYLRWGPDRGGFKGEVSPEAFEKMKNDGTVGDLDGRWYVKDGGNINPKKCDLVQDHRNHFVLGIDPKSGAFFQALISVKSTQVKKSRNLMSALAGVRMDDGNGGKFEPPTFANLVRLTTVAESNDEGSWYGYDFTIEGEVDDADLYTAAKTLNGQFAKGAVNVNYNAMNDTDGGGNAPTGGGKF